MSSGPDLEQRYRRVLRPLPRYYRDTWEEDMVAAFLDAWLSGDPDEDSVTMEYDRPAWPEIASVVTLAARLRLGGAGAPRRYYAWGQAVRGAVLAVLLANALRACRQRSQWAVLRLLPDGLGADSVTGDITRLHVQAVISPVFRDLPPTRGTELYKADYLDNFLPRGRMLINRR